MSRPAEGPDGVNLGDMGPPPENNPNSDAETEFNEPDDDQQEQAEFDRNQTVGGDFGQASKDSGEYDPWGDMDDEEV